MKPYVYIVIRKDIKPCNYAPQIAHAALEAGYQAEEPDETTHIVVLQVADKMELEMVGMSLYHEGIPYEAFHEGFGNMGLTALATLPTEKLENSCLQTLDLFSYKVDKPQSIPKISIDPHGFYYMKELPVTEETLFETEQELVDFYNKNF